MNIAEKICVGFTLLIVCWIIYLSIKGAMPLTGSDKHWLWQAKNKPGKYLLKPILAWALMMGVFAIPVFLFAFDSINKTQLVLFSIIAIWISFKIENKFSEYN